MKLIMATALLLVTLFMSGFVYAADRLPGSTSNPDSTVGSPDTTFVFAGPKLGWIKVPVTMERDLGGGVGQTTR